MTKERGIPHSQLIRAKPDVLKLFSFNSAYSQLIQAEQSWYSQLIQAENGDVLKPGL